MTLILSLSSSPIHRLIESGDKMYEKLPEGSSTEAEFLPTVFAYVVF